MFTLTKISLEEGSTSAVPQGKTTTGYSFNLLGKTIEEDVYSAKVEDLKVGLQVYITSDTLYHRTSPIQEIITQEPSGATFKTGTSIYTLTQE